MNDLETERRKMAAVLAEMTDGVLIIDQKGQIQLINPASERVFDTSGQAALGKSLAEVVRHYQIIELWEESIRSNQTMTASIEAGPKKAYLQIVISPLGSVLPGSTMILLQDLTQLRKLETVRRDFISNISHELRTPLAALKALTETLQESALEDPPAARRFLQQMETEVDALSLMVSELLELSRIESGRVPLQLVKTSPCEIVSQSVDRLSLQVERASLILDVDCEEELPLVFADSKRLEQVMVNLLHNAIKFTPAGGQILVKAEKSGTFVKFSVMDTGIGIAPNDTSRIFERFYKTDRSRSGGGTGLGLAIARHTVEAHGGRIWVVSTEGSGSTFFFTIPIA
jgi:two-component system phosphate regulon sensor histidine kinase PhoR